MYKTKQNENIKLKYYRHKTILKFAEVKKKSIQILKFCWVQLKLEVKKKLIKNFKICTFIRLEVDSCSVIDIILNRLFAYSDKSHDCQ